VQGLSHVVDDPHTAVQATEHLAVSSAAMVSAPAGDRVAIAGSTVAVVPERAFGDHLGRPAGVRRYGTRSPAVAQALLRMLLVCARLGAAEYLDNVVRRAS
jgi:uncharacterized membrane protein